MKYLLIFIIIANSISISLAANLCNIELNDTLSFGIVDINTLPSQKLVITNKGNRYVVINSITINSHYSENILVDSPNLPFNLPKGANVEIDITLNANQNVNINGLIFINFNCDENVFSLPVYFQSEITVGRINQNASITDNKWGPDLLSAISSYLAGHTSFSYKDARTMFWGRFDRQNGLVECVYTGKTIDPGDVPDFAVLDSKGFNTEHTWPKSMGAENEPPESDINHLFVTDKTTNDKRGNYPFGFVKSGITYENGGSKLGKKSDGKTAFEVRDKYKGNTARAMFYFALRYNNPNNFMNDQETDLRVWAKTDPVDNLESARNDSVFKYQKRSNLFIQFPALLDRIPSISQKSYPVYEPNYFVSDTSIVIDISSLAVNSQPWIRFWATNFSNTENGIEKSLEIESIQKTGDTSYFDITYNASAMTIPFNSSKYFDVAPTKNAGRGKMQFAINYANGIKKVVNLETENPIMSVNDSTESAFTITNFPNPAISSTNILISGINDKTHVKSVVVYDINYGQIADLTNSLIQSDHGIIVEFEPPKFVNRSNIFFVRIVLSGKSIIHPIMFLN